MGYPSLLWLGTIGFALAITGCASPYEAVPVSSGHPAHADTAPAPMDRSQTLADVEPVQTEPARSQHWADEAEAHDHEHMMSDEHDPDIEEHGNHEPEPDAHEHDAHEHHQHDQE